MVLAPRQCRRGSQSQHRVLLVLVLEVEVLEVELEHKGSVKRCGMEREGVGEERVWALATLCRVAAMSSCIHLALFVQA